LSLSGKSVFSRLAFNDDPIKTDQGTEPSQGMKGLSLRKAHVNVEELVAVMQKAKGSITA